MSRFQAFGIVSVRRIAALAVAAASVAALAEHGRFLPNPNPGGTGIVHTYGNTGGTNPNRPTRFDRGVTDVEKNINAGQIRFDYDTYVRNPAGTGAGGAVLSGGFFMAPGVRLKDGFTIAWVQTVRATAAGDNEWNLPQANAGWFPDADPRDRAPGTFGPDDTLLAPTYVFNTPAANNTGNAPTIGYQDFPGRGFAAGNQTWLAELGLVCISTTRNQEFFNADEPNNPLFGREVRVISTLLWGFDFSGLPVAMGNPGIGNVDAVPPGFWTNATGTYLNTLNEYYDGLGGGGAPDGMGGTLPAKETDLYRFFDNSNCFENIPEPSTAMLLIVAAGWITNRRRA